LISEKLRSIGVRLLRWSGKMMQSRSLRERNEDLANETPAPERDSWTARTPGGLVRAGKRGAWIIALCLVVAACDDTQCALDVQVVFSPATPTVRVGQSVVVSARSFTCSGREEMESDFRWETRDTLLIGVNALTGEVTGRAPGSAVLWANDVSVLNFDRPVTVTVVP
jgi:hypothetical protein